MPNQAPQHSPLPRKHAACAAATREQADTTATLYKPVNAKEAVEKGLQVCRRSLLLTIPRQTNASPMQLTEGVLHTEGQSY